MFFPDDEIEDPVDDEFNRATIAESIARWIAKHKSKKSIVISIQGQWGSGKSSLKKLIIKSFPATVSTLDFNPWLFQSHEKLVDTFFQDLNCVLSGKGMNASKELDDYSSALKVSSPLLPLITTMMASAMMPGVDPKVVAALSSTVGVASQSAGQLFANISKILNEEKNDVPLAVKKKSVENKLSCLDSPVVVFLDDIDRLTDDEIRLLFQFVKTSIDFPNMTYVLCFQRQPVVQALGFNSNDGELFLEKLINLPIDLPEVEGEVLQKLIQSKIEKTCITPRDLKGAEAEWVELFAILKSQFSTMRKGHRFLNALAFHKDLLSHGKFYEINVLDLAAIQALRIFEPGVFSQLFNLKKAVLLNQYFFYQESRKLSQEQKREEYSEFNAVLNEAKNPEFTAKCLAFLFPHLERFFNDDKTYSKRFELKTRKNETEETKLTRFRIAHELNFSRYFAFCVDPDDISKKDFEKVWMSLNSPEAFLLHLNTWSASEALFERLHAQRNEISQSNLLNYIIGILEIGEATGKFDRSEIMVTGALTSLEHSGDRLKLLETAITKTTTLYGLYPFIRRYHNQPTNDQVLGNKDAARFLSIVVDVIAERQASITAENPATYLLLFFWSMIDSKAATRYSKKLLDSKNGFFKVVAVLLDKTLVNYKMLATNKVILHGIQDVAFLKRWFETVYPAAIEDRINGLNATKLSESQRDVIGALQVIYEKPGQ